MDSFRHADIEEGLASPTSLRTAFASSLSNLYRNEVPLYASLVKLVDEINDSILASDPVIRTGLFQSPESLSRLKLERHGAIRLASYDELSQLARFLALMDMHPVGYYDLTLPPAHLPIHATCFRTFSTDALEVSPFRLFVSVLRHDLLKSQDDPGLQTLIDTALSSRPQQLFPTVVQDLIKTSKPGRGLTSDQAETLLSHAVPVFQFPHSSAMTSAQYHDLLTGHTASISKSLKLGPGAPALLADILSFPNPHINHLTPRTLSIDAVQTALLSSPTFPAKESGVEGPPGMNLQGLPRNCPVMLRQTSFCAVQETVQWADGLEGRHQARFGEIEQRGAAVTKLGRRLYDQYLAEVANDNHATSTTKAEVFEKYFPDDWEQLRQRGLIWVRYRTTGTNNNLSESSKDDANTNDIGTVNNLIQSGVLTYIPVTYEDFLPLSAAGIFKSNLTAPAGSSLDNDNNFRQVRSPSFTASLPRTPADLQQVCQTARADFENALRRAGTEVRDEMDIYEEIQEESLGKCMEELKAVRN